MGDVLAIIPARSGSKSVKNKNIRLINGKPMIAYSIGHAKQAACIDRVIVSTDSEEYAEIARKYGAETPFIRPAQYATDTALDIDVFVHALEFLKQSEGYSPELVVQLRPTYPIRRISDIENMVQYMKDHPDVDSMRCIAPAKEVAYKMWFKDEAERREEPMGIPSAYGERRNNFEGNDVIVANSINAINEVINKITRRKEYNKQVRLDNVMFWYRNVKAPLYITSLITKKSPEDIKNIIRLCNSRVESEDEVYRNMSEIDRKNFEYLKEIEDTNIIPDKSWLKIEVSKRYKEEAE